MNFCCNTFHRNTLWPFFVHGFSELLGFRFGLPHTNKFLLRRGPLLDTPVEKERRALALYESCLVYSTNRSGTK